MRRVRRERLGEDRIQITAQRPCQTRAERTAGSLWIGARRSQGGFGVGRTPCVGKRPRARNDFEQNRADGEKVGRNGHRFAMQLLWRGVVGRCKARSRLRQTTVFGGVAEQFGDAEVEQLHLAIRGHQNIGGLDVAVNDQTAMRIAERVEDILR